MVPSPTSICHYNIIGVGRKGARFAGAAITLGQPGYADQSEKHRGGANAVIGFFQRGCDIELLENHYPSTVEACPLYAGSGGEDTDT